MANEMATSTGYAGYPLYPPYLYATTKGVCKKSGLASNALTRAQEQLE